MNTCLVPPLVSIRRMNPNAWLERAERLRSTLARLRDAQAGENDHAHDEAENLERVAIAHWLREEFADEPREGTDTLLPFVTSHL